MAKLLTREKFNAICLERDGSACVCCGSEQNVTVHHIMERKLWLDGGYYDFNGVTICPRCHILAEAGFVLPEELWLAIGEHFDDELYPVGLDTSADYDKWGQELIYVTYAEEANRTFDKVQECERLVVKPNDRFVEKFEKAVRRAGGAVRATSPEWLRSYLDIEVDCNALYIAKMYPIQTIKSEGQY